MAAYTIGRINITDPDTYKKYTAKTPASIAKFGGRFLVRGGDVSTLEGDEETHRIVVVEFESREKALEWYHSDEYTKLRDIRMTASEGQLIIVDGAD